AFWIAPGRDDLLDDLDAWLVANEQSGRLATLQRALPPVATPAPDSARLLDLVGRRLLLMPAVARAKRSAGLPVEDRAREAQVEARARGAAEQAGFDADSWVAFVRAQMEAAKAIQNAASRLPDDTATPPVSLQQRLRPAIDRIDRSIAAEAARAA